MQNKMIHIFLLLNKTFHDAPCIHFSIKYNNNNSSIVLHPVKIYKLMALYTIKYDIWHNITLFKHVKDYQTWILLLLLFVDMLLNKSIYWKS